MLRKLRGALHQRRQGKGRSARWAICRLPELSESRSTTASGLLFHKAFPTFSAITAASLSLIRSKCLTTNRSPAGLRLSGVAPAARVSNARAAWPCEFGIVCSKSEIARSRASGMEAKCCESACSDASGTNASRPLTSLPAAFKNWRSSPVVPQRRSETASWSQSESSTAERSASRAVLNCERKTRPVFFGRNCRSKTLPPAERSAKDSVQKRKARFRRGHCWSHMARTSRRVRVGPGLDDTIGFRGLP